MEGMQSSAVQPRLRCCSHGRIETPATAELRRLFELQTDCHHIVLDLKDQEQVSYRYEFTSCFECRVCDFGGERTARERQGEQQTTCKRSYEERPCPGLI